MILDLINEAVRCGARVKPAAETIGLSGRTVIRWRSQGGGVDQRNGPRSKPANKLSQTEREQILDIANSPEFRELSPKQIVPKLADQGLYLASESSFYRVLKEHKMLTPRQSSKPAASRPPKEHVATGPCQLWSWDISVLQQRRMQFNVLREKLHERWRNRPSEVCLQGLASNHPQRHVSKVLVVSVEGKGVTNTSGMNREGEHK